MKYALFLTSAIVIVLHALNTSAVAQTGCNGQQPYDCANCTKDSIYRLRVCIGPVTDTIDVTMCTQFATTQPIINPCTNCTEPLNSFTWIRKVCVPTSLSLVSIDTIYRAIMSATSLCCDSTSFITAVIPQCDASTGPCSTIFGVYCHMLAFPKCVTRIGNCWQPCRQQCQDLCYVERRYCKSILGSCLECLQIVCSTAGDCPQQCITFNCESLYSPLGCCP
jgi:hypothetical protein